MGARDAGEAAARAAGGRAHAGRQLEAAARSTCACWRRPARTCSRRSSRARFRDDLYDRLNVVNIALPPLRARREDVPLLAEHYLRLASVENGFKPKRLAPRAVEFLAQLPWRGNVRELRNLMERLAVIVSRDAVSHRDVMEALHMTAPARAARTARRCRCGSRARASSASTSSSGSRPTAATSATPRRSSGIERTNLYRKMKSLGIGATEAPRYARSEQLRFR